MCIEKSLIKRDLSVYGDKKAVIIEVVQEALQNSTVVSILTYARESWTFNESHRCRIRAVEMIYMRGRCGVNKVNSDP